MDEGSLFLFQIYNKDFASGSTGKPNLHTMYWKHLFSTENLSDIVLQLNGGAELFYRKASIKEPIVHKPGTKVVNRTTKDGKPIPEALHTEIYNYENGKSSTLSPEAKELRDNESAANPDFIKTVKHTLTKNKRYTTDKYLFHVPITINFKADNKINMNEKVLAYLKQTQDVNIIGLDRGERNLLYVSVINKKGEILAQKSFNTIGQSRGGTSGAASTTVHVDYHEKLDQKEKSRDMARKNWQTIGKIAELKEGYLSAVIHELAKMMLEYNAILVLEDLNLGFKRTRFFREKQVYQKFEKMLLDKLNYLTLKDTPPREPGGILNGYQLTSKFESFEKLTKQSVFLFYIPASFTSKIDPKTGFVDMFNTRGLSNVQSKKEFFQKFESISYSGNNGFAFEFDYKNFSAKATAEMKQTKWTVYSRGKRIQFMGKSSASVDVEPTTELKTLFDANGIGFENGSDILSQILNIPADKAHASFFDTLYRMFSLVLQMRNSNAQTGEDFILSPVCAADGTFFDSRDYLNCKNPTMPTDADANGAYHIAKKGLLLLNRIAQTEDEKLKNMKLTISNAEWFDFVQST